MGKRKAKAKVQTIGDAIREHLNSFREREGDIGTDEGKKFLELPKEESFNTAGLVYVAALKMLAEAVQTVEDLMFKDVIFHTRAVGDPNNPGMDAAVMQGWRLLHYYGRLLVPADPKQVCACGHRRRYHRYGVGSCRKCSCHGLRLPKFG
ncbi:MAG TPA: hypothetical protein VI794_00615 [Patescibacteria group bacterium]|nr:hypothetical protein [Patescibacteria group bacterium]